MTYINTVQDEIKKVDDSSDESSSNESYDDYHHKFAAFLEELNKGDRKNITNGDNPHNYLTIQKSKGQLNCSFSIPENILDDDFINCMFSKYLDTYTKFS